MQSSKGNCMTDEVTEMPRCCSRRIQSEVAWRVALRPFTVPAIWMAPPNRSNFSVSVVLPASGWEIMAKVLRRLISLDISDSGTTIPLKKGPARWSARGPAGGDSALAGGFRLGVEDPAQHLRILAPDRGLVVATADADLLEPERMIQPGGGGVGGPYLEK